MGNPVRVRLGSKSGAACGLLLCLTTMMVGCGATAQDGGESPGETSGSEPDEVGTVSQPLGGFQDLFHDERDASPGALTTTYAFFTTYAPNTDCTNEMIFVNRNTGSSTDVPFDICRKPSAINYDSRTFIADMKNDDIVVHDSIGEGPTFWRKIADTQGDPRGPLMLNSTHVFWADSGGIKRMPRAGGAITVLRTGSKSSLHALDGSTLYYAVITSENPWTVNLRRMTTSGLGDTNLYTSDGQSYVFVDSDYVYFTEHSNGQGRIRRMSKTTFVVSTMVEHDDGRYYAHPQTYNGMLYWVEMRNWAGGNEADIFMRRRNLSNGNVVTVSYGREWYPRYMKVFSNGVFTASSLDVDGERHIYLRRGDL